MQTHDGHYVTLHADSEGIWFEMNTDTGEVATECLPWQQFHQAYQQWQSANTVYQERNELRDLNDTLRDAGLG